MNNTKRLNRKIIKNEEPSWMEFINKNDIYDGIARAEKLINDGDNGRSLKEVFDDIDRNIFNV